MTAAAQPEDARYAQVLSFPNGRELRRRLPPLIVGVFAIGFAIATSVRAALGVAPWDVLHPGLAHLTGLSFGLVVVLVGLVVLLAWIPLRQRMGVGTVINTLSIGFIANLGIYLIPEQHLIVVRVPMLLVSIVMFGVGGGLYIGAGLGHVFGQHRLDGGRGPHGHEGGRANLAAGQREDTGARVAVGRKNVELQLTHLDALNKRHASP